MKQKLTRERLVNLKWAYAQIMMNFSMMFWTKVHIRKQTIRAWLISRVAIIKEKFRIKTVESRSQWLSYIWRVMRCISRGCREDWVSRSLTLSQFQNFRRRQKSLTSEVRNRSWVLIAISVVKITKKMLLIELYCPNHCQKHFLVLKVVPRLIAHQLLKDKTK